MSPTLPGEICDQILDHIQHDKDALKNCALVSSSWLPRARVHLFRSVLLDWSSCNGFVNLVQKSPDLARLITKLDIEGVMGIFSMDRSYAETLRACLHIVPAAVPETLTSLTSLDLGILTLDAEMVDAFLGRLTTVTSLKLWACAVASPDLFIRLFLSYPNLKNLTIVHTQGWDAVWELPMSAAPCAVQPMIESLRIVNDSTNFQVLRWLISQDLHRGLHTLSLICVLHWNIAFLYDVLEPLSGTLRHLIVGFGDIGDATHPSPTTLRALTSLTLKLSASKQATFPFYLAIPHFLGTPALQTLTVSVSYSSVAKFLSIPWKRLARMVPKFGQVEHVCIQTKMKAAKDNRISMPIPGREQLSEMESCVTAAFEPVSGDWTLRFEHTN